MGCFLCFDSKEGEQLNVKSGVRDDRREGRPVVESHISRLSSGVFMLSCLYEILMCRWVLFQ